MLTSLANSLSSLAELGLVGGATDRARELIDEVLTIRHELGDRGGLADALVTVTRDALAEGDAAAAGSGRRRTGSCAQRKPGPVGSTTRPSSPRSCAADHAGPIDRFPAPSYGVSHPTAARGRGHEESNRTSGAGPGASSHRGTRSARTRARSAAAPGR